MSFEVAHQVLTDLQDQIQIEPEWLREHEHGFEWWPGWLGQRIWLVPYIDDDGGIARLHIESDFLRSVPANEKTLELVAFGNRLTTFSSLVFSPDDHTVRLHASFCITPDNAKSLPQLARIVAWMQMADADAKSTGLAPVFGGDPDFTNHPLSGRRPLGHMALHTLELLRDENASAPNLSEVDFTPLKNLDPSPWIVSMAGKGGMTAELPFIDNTPALLAFAAGDDSGPRTALFQATTDFDHLQLGQGVLFRLTLPIGQGAELANRLNLAEASAHGIPGAHQLGAWCSRESDVVFATFVAASLFDRGLFECLAWGAGRRAAWARDLLVRGAE